MDDSTTERLTDDTAQRLRAFLAAVRRRWFTTVALRAVGIGAAAAAVPGLAAVLAYAVLSPQGVPLLLLAGTGLILSVAAAGAVAWRIERRPDDRRVARFIEERAEARPGSEPLNDCVVSAVQAMSLPPSDPRAPFAALVLRGALECLERVTAADLIPSGVMRHAALVALSGVALLAVALVLSIPPLAHAIETARMTVFPAAVTVDVLPGDVRVVAGQPLRIRARIHSGGSDLTRLSPQLVVSSGSERRVVEMVRGEEGFDFAFESVDRSFRYLVAVGRVQSSEHSVTALFAPRVTRIDIDYEYPSFSGLPARTQQDAGDIYAPAGSRVRLTIQTDKPLAGAELALTGAVKSIESRGSVAYADLVLSKDDSYRIRLTDQDGLRSDGDSEYFIRVMDDRPPDVRILRPAADQGITPLEEVAIEARAEDDYGVASFDLVFAVGGGKERAVPFGKLAGTDLARTGSHLLAAEELNVRPGDVITYYARARDIGRGKRPTEATSDIFFLEVRPFNEEFVAAQSQAQASAGGDPQIESLIEAQKEIISATWNIERRSAAGRSADDVKAIAQAQADLKARAERLILGQRGRRGREFLPQRIVQTQQPGRPQGSDPAAIIEAMVRAAEQLSGGRTRDAIPHEMAALNGLMQAQAEVRRRQITQQANASGNGWGNRQSQDLSALFDKELQRQQRTNYEQRSQVEERPNQQQDQGAIDRIRDLARRQEELSRAQREAAKLAAEERRRQLDRLMREQQELQRQAEELARQMSGQSGQQQSQPQQQQSGQSSGQQQTSGPQTKAGGQPSGSQQSQQADGRQTSARGSENLREAADQMRQAASELGREDGESAARRGDRAAEQLRRIEEQMQGGGADARQRASADLRSEAQQILQEQRRIASEAQRLEKSGDAGADARRRLAADKDRLADRVDGLQNDAQRLARQEGGGQDQARAREASSQLEKDQVGQRMRESARQLRDGAAQPSGQSEQQLARSLEQAVDKLGSPAGTDARQMAQQLEASKQTRERLDALEAKLREAEKTGKAQAERLRQEYQQELKRTREELGREAGSADASSGFGRSTPEEHEFSRSAPGTEAFKQDRSGWESLRREVNRALEQRDEAASRRLAKALAEDRLTAGGSERVPEQYQKLIARYFESLGRTRK